MSVVRVFSDVSVAFLYFDFSGLPRVKEKSGKLKFFQGQGIVREFCKLSGKFGKTVKCQGINCKGILKILDSSPTSE